jgi:hypothetical protein
MPVSVQVDPYDLKWDRSAHYAVKAAKKVKISRITAL